MPQVNAITLDIAPSNDFSPVQSGATTSSPSPKKDFAQVIDQHYQSQQSGKKQESSGNKAKLDTKVLPEKENVQEKSSTTGVQPKDKETGTVTDENTGAEISEITKSKDVSQSIPEDKINGEKVFQIENSKLETSEQTVDVLINVDSKSKSPQNMDNTTEQFMSLLSASQKILTEEVKNKLANTPETSEKLPAVESSNKHKENTELDALLKQVLGGNNKIQTDNAEANSAANLVNNSINNSPDLKDSKNLTEQVKTQTSIKNEELIKKVDSHSKPIVAVDKAIKGDSKLDLSVLTEKTSGIDQASSMKTTDIKNLVITQTNLTETVSKTTQAIDKSANAAKQQMSASEVKALLVDVESSPIETDLNKIEVALLGSQDKTAKIDKSIQSNIKVDTPIAKQDDGLEVGKTLQNEKLESEIDINIDADDLNTDKVAFAGVSVSGEKQAQENNQNHSRVINQATQKVLEPQTSNAGEQYKEQTKDQSLEQQNQKQTQSSSNTEKLANNEAQVKEKSFNELFDKKIVSASIESTLARDIHQVNEATKSAASAEEMITKLTSENVQSTAQSVTNAKQVTSLQNEALSVYRKDFSGALKDKVMVMMNQKLQQVEIRLDPQELGNVNVKINLQNEQAVVSFVVQNQQAKEAFDQNLGRLKDMLAESGVDVGDANVEQQSKQNDDEALGDGRQSGEGDTTSNELSELSDTQTLNLVKGSSTGVDYYA